MMTTTIPAETFPLYRHVYKVTPKNQRFQVQY